MKLTSNGRRYDSARCEVIAEREHWNNGIYSGTTSLLRAGNGDYLLMTDASGQDLFLRDYIAVCENPGEELERMEMTDEQEARAIELGLIKEV